MTALKSKRALLGLVAALAAVAAILTSGLLRGDEAPAGKDAAPVVPVAGSGGPTDRLIAGFQRRLKDDPEDFSSYVNLANAYLQKVRETGDPSLYAKAEDLLDRAEKIEAHNPELFATRGILALARQDRKSTRLNSSHANISYAVFCLKKKISLSLSFLS